MEPFVNEPRPSPSVRNRARAVRGRRGGLANMPEMPLDVIFEILGYLHPRDVLSLARTSREWRELLMSKTSVRLWKAARANVHGLPDCPTYLSEPAYANLMFMTNCHWCLKPGIRKVLWRHSSRYCPACVRDVAVSWQEDQEFRAAAPEFYLGDVVDRRSRPHFEALKAKWFSLADEAAKAAYLVEHANTVENILRKSRELERWLNYQGLNRKLELYGLKGARFEAVKARLRDEGWGKELDMYGDMWLERHKLVRAATKLTDRAWENMRPEIVQHMEERRARRLVMTRRTTVRARVAHLFDLMKEPTDERPLCADWGCNPRVIDFALMPEFRELLEAHSDTDVDDALANLVSQAPQLASRWRNERKSELDVLVQAPRECGFVVHSDVPGIFVHRVAFECTECPAAAMPWPAVLGHACTRARRGEWAEPLPDNSNALAVELQSKSATPAWSAASLVATTMDASPVLAVLVGLCSLNSRTATRADLDESPMRFVCGPCLFDKAVEGRPPMYTWIQAAEHRLRTAADGTGCLCGPSNQALAESWHYLEENDTDRLADLEELRDTVVSLKYESLEY